MSRTREYPDVVTGKKCSVLPPELQTDIAQLVKAINDDQDPTPHLSSFVRGIKVLPAEAISRACEEIPLIGTLRRRYDHVRTFWSIFRRTPKPTRGSDLDALARYPQLAQLFIFHRDGWLREAALHSLSKPPDNPFEFTAVVYRLNDWVEPVRSAAAACARRLFPRTSANVVAEASLFLFRQIPKLGRWGERERGLLESTLYRSDVIRALAELLSARRSGPVALPFRHALRRPGLDDMLPRLASESPLPLVRAIAFETLIMKRARWLVQYRYEWVDKRFNIRRLVPEYDSRPVDHQLPVENLLRQAAKDSTVAVRKVAVRGLIDLRNSLSSDMSDLAHALAQDESSAIRERGKFYLNDRSSD